MNNAENDDCFSMLRSAKPIGKQNSGNAKFHHFANSMLDSLRCAPLAFMLFVYIRLLTD